MRRTGGRFAPVALAALLSMGWTDGTLGETFRLVSDANQTDPYATIENGYTVSGTLTIDTTDPSPTITDVKLAVSGGVPISYSASSITLQQVDTYGTSPNLSDAYEVSMTAYASKSNYILDLFIDLGTSNSLASYTGGYLLSDSHAGGAVSSYTKDQNGKTWNLKNGYLTAVPEPSSMVLGGTSAIAVLGLALFRRRRLA